MNICVYGASSDKLDSAYFEAAHELGRLMALDRHTLVFGGGAGGLMGACARGAAEAGGEIVGIAPRFFDEPGVLYERCTRFLYTDTMRQRKQLMEDESEAFIALPGGIGTFEEFFETLTLKQLGRHGKPMVLLNTLGYYDPLMSMLRAAADGRFMSRGCFDLFSLCASPAQAMDSVINAKTLSGSIKRLADYTN